MANEVRLFDNEQLEILAEAIDLDIQEKQEYKDMNDLCATASKDLLIDKQTLKRFKDYNYYYGRGWVNGDPLERAKGDDSVEYPDRVSSTMIKFAQIINDCVEVGDVNFLIPYLQALKNKYGITITLDAKQGSDERLKRVDQYIQPMCSNQAKICNIADQIKGPITDKAIESKICSKSRFRSLVRLNSRIQKRKEKGEEPSKEIDNLTTMYMDSAYDCAGAEKSINGCNEKKAESLDAII